MKTTKTAEGSPMLWASIQSDRLRELQDVYETSLAKASKHEIYRDYVEGMAFAMPEQADGAKSIIVAVIRSRPAIVTVTLKSIKTEISLPPGYWDDGITSLKIGPNIRTAAGLGSSASLIPIGGSVPNKLLAARTGIVEYGRNNITYARGMGSFIALRVFATDAKLPESPWGEIKLMSACASCDLCIKNCPTGAVRAEEFIIDAGKCITLYNEIDGTFPPHIARARHSALLGCTQCQYCCPVNKPYLEAVRLETLDEEESQVLLEASGDERVGKRISEKLKLGDPDAYASSASVLSRNLKAFLGIK